MVVLNAMIPLVSWYIEEYIYWRYHIWWFTSRRPQCPRLQTRVIFPGIFLGGLGTLRISVAFDCLPDRVSKGAPLGYVSVWLCLKINSTLLSVDMFGGRMLGKRTFVWADRTNTVAIKSKTVLNSNSFFTRALWKHMSLCDVHF
jgi:hypothetical protein